MPGLFKIINIVFSPQTAYSHEQTSISGVILSQEVLAQYKSLCGGILSCREILSTISDTGSSVLPSWDSALLGSGHLIPLE